MRTSRFPRAYFQRVDESEDNTFYENPRLVVHIDDAAIKAAGALYAELLPPKATLIDLMSSWRSHLPASFEYTKLVGLGMNTVELAQNPQLNDYVVHNLNTDPRLPFDDASFDGAMCTVSVQYLTQPVAVFAEVGRVLRVGAPFIVTFSNRCFPTKAVRVWTETDDQQHTQLVQSYFEDAECFENIGVLDRSPRSRWSDPLYAVVGQRNELLLSPT